MKNILVPTDFSTASLNAGRVAIEIAKKAQAQIHFLHIINIPIDWVRLNKQQEKSYPEIKKKISLAKNELAELVKTTEQEGLKAQTFLSFNKDSDEIIDHLKQLDHDFIITASKRDKQRLSFFSGSITPQLIRYSPCPVLVVPEGFAWRPFKRMVFASNFNDEACYPFEKIVEFADLFDSEIDLLYVNMPFHFEESDQSRAKMKGFLRWCPRGGTCNINIYNSLNEERGILKFIGEAKADLLAITTQGRTGFMKMISPSITESLVRNSEVPVLSINLDILPPAITEME